jgi:hypothetical protein
MLFWLPATDLSPSTTRIGAQLARSIGHMYQRSVMAAEIFLRVRTGRELPVEGAFLHSPDAHEVKSQALCLRT